MLRIAHCRRHLVGALLGLLAAAWLWPLPAPAVAPLPAPGDGSLLFVANAGQFDPAVRFVARTRAQTLWLTADALWLSQPAPAGQVALRLTFAGANPAPALVPFARQDTLINYYQGNDPARWRAGVPTWGGVRYRHLYPGVDLEVYGLAGQWAWRLVGQDGAPLATTRLNQLAAQLRVEGADALAPSAGASLPPLDGAAPVTAAAPQDIPSALVWSTFIGGSNFDEATALALDSGGASFITGVTFSPDLPATPGLDTTLGGNSDAFVARIRPDGSGLHYLTYLGGNYNPPPALQTWMMDRGNDIAVDGSGAAYVTGHTFSNDFPTTPGAYDTSYNGGKTCVTVNGTVLNCGDAFVTRLAGNGQLDYSTFLGGSYLPYVDTGGDDDGKAIAVAADGRVFVTGFTTAWDFPTTSGAYKRVFANEEYGLNDDIILSVFNLAGQGSADLLYSTFIGGGWAERGSDLAVDGAGFVYLTGEHDAQIAYLQNLPDFPTTPGAFDPGPLVRGKRAFVIKFFPGRQGAGDLRYATFYGAPTNEAASSMTEGHALSLDAAGAVYISGWTDAATMATTPGAFDRTLGGTWGDVFVAKFTLGGQGAADLGYATYLGGAGADGFWGSDLALAANGDVFVTGDTFSSDFPTTPGAYQLARAGEDDVFVARLHLGGQGAADLTYGSYVGRGDDDDGAGIAVTAPDVVRVAGWTYSNNFPTTPGAFDTTFGGGACDNANCPDGFLFELRMATPTTPAVDAYLAAPALAPGPSGGQAAVPIRFGNLGATAAANVTITATLHLSLTYGGDTSGVTPVVAGNNLTWQLPNLAPFAERQFVLTVGLPAAPLGTQLPLALTIGSAGPEGLPANNQATTAAWVAQPSFLPLIATGP